MHLRLVLAVIPVILAWAGSGGAQIISSETVDGRQVQCIHSGLFSDLSDCGTKSYSYTYVFVGSISAISAAKGDEKQIQILPEEIFLGKPQTPVTVLTSQGLCLPRMAVGDRWLFYLREKKNEQIILDYYGNDSLPVAQAQEQIETLRRLETVGDFAIVRGKVIHGPSLLGDGTGLPYAKVVAQRAGYTNQYISTATADGRYEFQPLPPGEYDFKIDPGTFKGGESGITLKPGSCANLTIAKTFHAQISGRVQHADGSPVAMVDVVLLGSNQGRSSTLKTDKDGRFRFDSLAPGKYRVAVKLQATLAPKSPGGAAKRIENPDVYFYYPTRVHRSGARLIMLSKDETRDDVNIVLPAD